MAEKLIYYNILDEVGGYDGGMSEKVMREVEVVVREQVPGAEISLGKDGPDGVVVMGRPPEAVTKAVEEVLRRNHGLGKPLFPMRTELGSIQLGVSMDGRD